MIKSARIAISKNRVTVLMPCSTFSRKMKLVADVTVTDPTDSAQLINAIADHHSSCKLVRIILADAWVRYFMVTPPGNASSIKDCQAAATMRFLQIYDDDINDWVLRADWQAHQPFLSCAIPSRLLHAIDQLATTSRMQILNLQPQWIAIANHCKTLPGQHSWLAVVHQARITLGMWGKKHLQGVYHLPLTEQASKRALQARIRSEALRNGLALPKQVLLYGDTNEDFTESSENTVDATTSEPHLIDMHITRNISSGERLARSGLAL